MKLVTVGHTTINLDRVSYIFISDNRAVVRFSMGSDDYLEFEGMERAALVAYLEYSTCDWLERYQSSCEAYRLMEAAAT